MDEELPKIGYLFGAGASAQKLPTVKELPERIKAIRSYIEENYVYINDDLLTVKDFSFKDNDAKEFILEGLDKLYVASQNHSTVDTYAKKLYLLEEWNEIEELIFSLALYFNIEQKVCGCDPRYNTSLISILDSSAIEFPVNLKFLSWNYDLQFEIAYHDLKKKSSLDVDFYLFNTSERLWGKNKFSSIKINGSCIMRDSYDRRLFNLIKNLKQKTPSNDDMKFALEFSYTQIKNRKKFFSTIVNIDFAWSKDSTFIDKISELHNETEVLVVIGYSFPFFNREVDRKIIRAMGNLRTIYIQDINADNIVSRFLSILPDYKKRNIEIIPITAVDEFFLPPEL
ncbi:MAG: hypothetical protein ABI203_00055 [Mucilaginibacter sp.]